MTSFYRHGSTGEMSSRIFLRMASPAGASAALPDTLNAMVEGVAKKLL